MFQQLELSSNTLALFSREQPQFLHGIRFALENRLPHVKLSIFSYSIGENMYFYGFRSNDLSIPNVIFHNRGIFEAAEFLEGFERFQRAINLFDPPKFVVFMADVKFTDQIIKYVEENNLPFSYGGTLNNTFLISKNQENLILDMAQPTLPPGYSLGDADPEDAEFITSFWRFATPAEAVNTREKLKTFPSSCIRFEGKPVAFEMVNVDGSLNHQFVLEEHRRKGLGAALEMDLTKKCVRAGLIVNKTVDIEKKSIIEASRRCDYWTTMKNPGGTDVIIMDLFIDPKKNA